MTGNNNSTIDGGREGRTSPSLEEGAQSPQKVDDNVATSPRPTLPTPTPPPPTPATASPPPSPAPPTLAPPPAILLAVEAPVSSRLRTRSERSQKLKASMGLVPSQGEGQSKKRKAPKEGEESAKRAKTVVENTTTAARNRAGARNAGTNKQGIASKSSRSIIF